MADRIRKRPSTTGGYQLGVATPGGTFTVPVYTNGATCIDAVHKGPPYLRGGNLSVVKTTYKVNTSAHCYAHRNTTTANRKYDGKFRAEMPSLSTSPPTDLTSWGAKGWNRTVPVKPIADLGTSIGELKDLPGMIRQTRDALGALGNLPFAKKGVTLGDFKSARHNGANNPGSNYLNVQFGWVPIVRDILTMLDARKNLDKKLNQLRRDNGRAVRRRAVLDERHDVSHSVAGPFWSSLIPILDTRLYATGQSWENQSFTITEYKRKIWYSARYRYFIPGDMLSPSAPKTSTGFTALENRLLGLELTANTLYNLTPWSWLADWFTSTGAVVQNALLRSQYSVLADYAYVMCTEVYKATTQGTCKVNTGTWTSESQATKVRFHASSSVEVTYKTRKAANPFGFGITDADLNPYQWSILAALGLSRLR